MVAIKFIAYVAFGVIFLGMSFTMISQYQQGAAERAFLDQAKQLAVLANTVGGQDVGASQILSMTIPNNAQLNFQDNVILAIVGSGGENFQTGFSLSGATLGAGSYQLRITRTQSGVDISAA